MANSINELISNPDWLKEIEKSDANVDNIRSFHLPGNAIIETVTCSTSFCKMEKRTAASATRMESGLLGKVSTIAMYHPMIFCFACNRVYHLQCVNLTLTSLMDEKVPWRCEECRKEENNLTAVQYYASNDWKKGLKSRRAAFLKKKAVNENPSLLEPQAEDEFDKEDEDSFIDDNSHYITLATYRAQQNDMQQLAESFKEVLKQNKLMQEKLDSMPTFANLDESARPSFNTLSSTRCEKSGAVIKSSTQFLKELYGNTKKDVNLKLPTVNENAEEDMADKSSLLNGKDIDHSQLNVSELVLLEQAAAQRESSSVQRKMSSAMMLEQNRKAMPKMSKFSGDAKEWIRFKRDIKRYQEVGKYEESLMKMFILQSLTGIALDRVQDMIDVAPLAQTLKMLEESFGNPSRIIEKCSDELLAVKIGKEFYKDDALVILTKIQAYFSACSYANVSTANSNQLAKQIFDQLNIHHKQMYRMHQAAEHRATPNKLMDLETMFTFLEDLAKVLEDKKAEDKKGKSVQVMSASISYSSNESTSGDKDKQQYAIMDIQKFKHMGYDMRMVGEIERRCECCNQNDHFTVECRKFQRMDNVKRIRFANEKRLCRNCLITSSHRAVDCKVKPSCGLRIDNGRCKNKHHASLHYALSGRSNNNDQRFRRNNSNKNTNRAAGIYNGSSSSTQQHPNANEQSSSSQVINSAPTIAQLGQQPNLLRPEHKSSRPIVTGCTLVQPAINHVPYQTHNVLLKSQERTVKVFKNQFLGRDGYVIGYSIGDSAAEVTLMNEELRKVLKLEGEQCNLDLQWTDSTTKTVKAVKVDLQVCGVHDGAKKLMLKDCYAVDDLNLPPRSLNIEELKRRFPYLKKVKFESYENAIPLLLIGSTHASVFESCGPLLEGGEGKPVGLLAKLGWCVYGGCPEIINNVPVTVQSIAASHEVSTISNDELYDLFTFFNSVENLGLKEKSTHSTADEINALEIMEDEMRILPDGSVEVPLVWNRIEKVIPKLPNNFAMVLKRQLAQEAKLSRNAEHLSKYNDKFKELITEGYVRAATNEDIHCDWPNVNYLPMTLVINQNKMPIGYRIVFDAAARYLQTSLNANLLKGPDLLINILTPLIYMRTKKVAFTADIKAMFMRMRINLRDQQCQRVLWRESIEEPMKVFIVSSMLFGPTCSPFQSQYVKNMIAESWREKYPEAADTIVKYMYMDDVLTSESSTEKAAELAFQCIEIFSSINWNLISFQSNNIDFLKMLPENHVKHELIPLMESERESCITKVLGCVWDTKQDSFVFSFDKNLFMKIVQECHHKPTKRDQSSTIARVFDVLGLISHFMIRGKIILQRSWDAGIDWDDEVTEADHQLWLEWLQDLEKVSKVRIPRRLCEADDLNNSENAELHIFCDAGLEAYAAVGYLVTTHRGKRTSNLVMARARVTPRRFKSGSLIKEMPRLELYAALLGSRIYDTVTKILSGVSLRRFLWSDSEVVLRWILNPNSTLIKYAISPVEEILENTQRSEWKYVPSKLNVADLATKFKKIDFADSNGVWFKGPEFLLSNEKSWPPPVPEKLSSSSRTVEARNLLALCVIKSKELDFQSPIKLPPLDCLVASEFDLCTLRPSVQSTWTKMVRATARALKLHMEAFIPMCEAMLRGHKWMDPVIVEEIKEKNDFSVLTSLDLDRAELFLTRRAQRQSYGAEYEAIRNGKTISNQELGALLVFIDDQGVMRINSRVKLNQKIYPQQFSPVLPRENAYTRILLWHVHCEYQHNCREYQMAAIRSRYWITDLRSALKSIQEHCNFCKFMRARPYAPLMAPLPPCRIDPSQFPFQATGLDCAGPISIICNGRYKKIWMLIFSCTLSRFIQLFILESLESIKVLEAIACFWSSNGPIQTLISDNGTNFVGAARIIREERERTAKFLAIHHKQLASVLAEKYRIDWKFLPAHSPWMGGFYERLIKEVKRSISSTLENKKLTKTELNIALQDACHRINNRPLTHNSVSSEDEPVLTPHMLAKGRPGWPYLPGAMPSTPPNPREDKSTFRRARSIADDIMRKFTLYYLPVLTKRTKWFKDTSPLKVGDLVLLIEPNNTRDEWKRGRIVKLYKSSDGRSRIADVMIADQVLKKARSVQRLAKLEIVTNDNA